MRSPETHLGRRRRRRNPSRPPPHPPPPSPPQTLLLDAGDSLALAGGKLALPSLETAGAALALAGQQMGERDPRAAGASLTKCSEGLGEALAGLAARAEVAQAEKVEAEAREEAKRNAPPPPPPAPNKPSIFGGAFDGLLGAVAGGGGEGEVDERGLLEKVTTSVLKAEWYVGPLDQVPSGSWEEARACMQSASGSLGNAGAVLATCRTGKASVKG